MTPAIETPTRRIESICPPWCAGHDGAYQGWDDTPDGTQIRNHAESGHYIGGLRNGEEAGVEVSLVEHEDHTLAAPKVAVVTGNDSTSLTPSEARELGQLLIDAADRAEAHR